MFERKKKVLGGGTHTKNRKEKMHKIAEEERSSTIGGRKPFERLNYLNPQSVHTETHIHSKIER